MYMCHIVGDVNLFSDFVVTHLDNQDKKSP